MRKVTPLFMVLLSALLLLSGFVFFSFFNEDVKQVDEQENGVLTYAIVNEDVGATYNKKTFNLGKDFLNLIEQDSDHKWVVASYDVARNGYNQGQYDALIILPQDFSENILSLESLTPEQAQIVYEINGRKNALANQVTKQKIGEILNNFNNKVVQMYFSSVLGNLSDAQRSMAQIVKGDIAAQKSLEKSIRPTLLDFPNQFKTITDATDSLKDRNSQWKDSQNAFTKLTNGLLKDTSKELTGQQEAVKQFDALQQKISGLNEQAVRANLEAQSEQDEENYNAYFEGLHTAIESEFAVFGANESEANILATFKETAKDFENQQNEVLEDVTAKIEAIQKVETTLTESKEDVVNHYFNGVNPTEATNEDIKQAIKNYWITPSLNESTTKLDNAYFDDINQQINNLAIRDLKNMIAVLEHKEVISTAQKNKYEQELQLIERYMKEQNIPSTKEQMFQFIEVTNEEMKEPPQYHEAFNITANLQEVNTFTFEADNSNLVLKDTDAVALANELTSKFDKKLQEANVALKTKVVYAGKTFTVQFEATDDLVPPVEEQLDVEDNTKELEAQEPVEGEEVPTESTEETNEAELTEPETEENTMPTQLSVIIAPTITWELFQPKESFNEATYVWKWQTPTVSEVIHTNTVSFFIDLSIEKDALIEDVSPLLEQMKYLEQAVQSIYLIYGNAESLNNYLSKVEASPEKTVSELATPESIYLRYGKLSDEEKENLITSDLVAKVGANGRQLYTQLDEQLGTLQAMLVESNDNGTKTLGQIKQSLTLPEQFTQQADAITNWYTNAVEEVHSQYEMWEKSPELGISLAAYDGKRQDDTTLYYDNTSSNALYDDYTTLAQTTSSAASSIRSSATKIENINEGFKGLNALTKEAKSKSSDVLSETNDLVVDMTGHNKKSKDYHANFSTVMNNTQKGTGDNQQVYNFLSNPIGTKGTVEAAKQVSLIPYFMTVMTMLLAIVCSYGFARLNLRRRLKDSDALVEPTRLWLNLPALLKIVGVSSIISLVFVLLTVRLNVQTYTFSWMMYVFITTLAVLVFSTGCMRLIPKTAFVSFVVVAGLYLLLSPMIGISVVSGSFAEGLYRLSPFQNIEDGYSALIAGQVVGSITYLLLIFGMAIGVVLNLVSKNEVDVEE